MNRIIAITLVLGLTGVFSASAELILNINTTDKTFAFTGSDSGTVYDYNAKRKTGKADWLGYFAGPMPEENVFSSVALTGELLFSQGSLISGDFSGTHDSIAGNYAVKLYISLTGLTEGSGITITGSGTYTSYADWQEDSIYALESMVDGSLPRQNTTDFSAVTVQSVPEPAGIAFLGLGAVALALRRRVA